MLDRKTEDIDARVELLKDRQKGMIIFFLFFYTMGLVAILVSIATPLNWDATVIGIGIAFMIIGTYIMIVYIYYDLLIYLKKQFEKGKKNG